MSFRSVFSKFKFSRSHQEYSEQAGLILSSRLKDLLAASNEQSNKQSEPFVVADAVDSQGSIQVEERASESSAVKTAA
jgi:hypothetical protein